MLKALKVQGQHGEDDGGQSRLRPHSPVKLLSNIFGGSIAKEGARKIQRNPPSLGDVPRILPPQPGPNRTHGREGELARPTSASKTIGFNSTSPTSDPLFKLEETLATLVLAMQARKGNIVGRSVRARATADELAVNELYNSLLENPANHELAAHAAVDVLFAAFEKFLKVAWTEKMGPLVSQTAVAAFQAKADSMYPGEFEDMFRTALYEMSPQNQRGLRTIVKLLADLLEGTGNDGDRGILTMAFAEVLAPEGNSNDFISLVDRLVQDSDALFGAGTSGLNTPSYGSIDSKARSAAAGSLNSNTSSSLRKRFGLARENSKTETESKVGSLWRSLSKNSHVESQPSSLSRAGGTFTGVTSLARSNSTDSSMRLSPKRPSSRDRPSVLGAFTFETGCGTGIGDGRSYFGAPLGTIGEVPSASGPPRKKRRSSLSDLKMLQTLPSASASNAPSTPRGAHSRQASASPRVGPPLRGPASPGKPPTSSQIPAPSRLGSPMRKENSPATVLERATGSAAGGGAPTVSTGRSKHKQGAKSDEITIKSHSPTKRRTDSTSGIPTLKSHAPGNGSSHASGGLSERPTSGNAMKLPPVATGQRSPTKATLAPTLTATSSASPKKLKMQSPQKLRERLQTQQAAIDSAGHELQVEMTALGHELDKTARNSRTGGGNGGTGSSSSASTGATRTLDSRLLALEKTLRSTLETLTARTAAIGTDVSSSLQVSEQRARNVDALYREMNAENEALYARFNDELERVSRAAAAKKPGAKAGDEGDVELDMRRRRMAEMDEELVRLRRENARLKREVGGLKAQLKD